LNIGFFSIQVDTVTISGYPRAPPPPVIHRFSTGYPQGLSYPQVFHRLSTVTGILKAVTMNPGRVSVSMLVDTYGQQSTTIEQHQ